MAKKKAVKKVEKKVDDVITVEREGREVTVIIDPANYPRMLECRRPGGKWEFMYNVPTTGARFKVDTRKNRIVEVRLVRIIQTQKL